MKSITDKLQLARIEAKELSCRMSEFKEGLRAQISSILSAPPVRKPPSPLVSERVPDLIDLESSHEIAANVRTF